MKIILHSDDMALLEYWEKVINEDCYVIDDIKFIKSITNSIIILNYSSCNYKCEEILNQITKNNNKVLILDRTPSLHVAKELLYKGAKGYGNALMKGHFILSAIDTIRDGMVWLHPSFTTMLIEDLPSSKNEDNSLLELLTSREKEVALLLKDGKLYKDIAQKLDITVRTVKAHAQHIYSKLKIKDKLALALLLK